MSKTTAANYKSRLSSFRSFIEVRYSKTLAQLIKDIHDGKADVYEILGNFVGYLAEHDHDPNLIKTKVVTTRNFLEFHDVEISPRKFKVKVRLPKTVRKEKEPLDKNDVREILNLCSDIRMKTFIMFLASAGTRAVEALSVRLKDVHFDSSPTTVLIRGEYTKTKVDRTAYLTDEMVKQLEVWLEFKYRERRKFYLRRTGEKGSTIYHVPEKKPEDLVFGLLSSDLKITPKGIYPDISRHFARTLDRIGKGQWEDSRRRRKITLHSFRRFVKSTISDLGYSDYSEWFIGHSGSTYWRKKESEKVELFRKVEAYLTFLDYTELEARGVDMQSRLEAKEKDILALKHQDGVNTDAIANLSDQVIRLANELREVRRRAGLT